MLADLGQKEMSNFQFGSFSQTGVLRSTKTHSVKFC